MEISDLIDPGLREQWDRAYRSQLANSQTAASIMGQQRSAQAQVNAMQNQMLANAQTASPYTFAANTSGLTVTGNTIFGFRSTSVAKKALEHPLYDVPVSALKNLWGAKFGMRWVPVQELEALDDGDESWRTLFSRLRSLHVIEEAFTFDSNEQLYRLPPE